MDLTLIPAVSRNTPDTPQTGSIPTVFRIPYSTATRSLGKYMYSNRIPYSTFARSLGSMYSVFRIPYSTIGLTWPCSHPPTACTERQQRSAHWIEEDSMAEKPSKAPKTSTAAASSTPTSPHQSSPSQVAGRTLVCGHGRLRTPRRACLTLSGRPRYPLWGCSRPSKEAGSQTP
jgi:hypothetical protein